MSLVTIIKLYKIWALTGKSVKIRLNGAIRISLKYYSNRVGIVHYYEFNAQTFHVPWAGKSINTI